MSLQRQLYTNSLCCWAAGVGGSSCSELGAEYKDVTFYRCVTNVGSSTATFFTNVGNLLLSLSGVLLVSMKTRLDGV
jgi:hypothetical protein